MYQEEKKTSLQGKKWVCTEIIT